MAKVVATFEGLVFKSSAAVPALEAWLAEESGAAWAVAPFDGDDGRWFAAVRGEPRTLSHDEAWSLVERLQARVAASASPAVEAIEPLFASESQGWGLLDRPDDEGPGLESGFDDGDFGPASQSIAWLLNSARVTGLHAKWTGRNVIIGHPDTGYSRHTEVHSRVDTTRAKGFLADGQALDPGRGFTPFHGTGTGSILVSPHGQPRDDGNEVLGVAPGATIVPLRVTDNVVLLSQRALTRAIDYARECGCDVVSMSLGGVPSAALHAAIERAVNAGMILCAAAGNYSPIPGWPARDPLVIAVGGVDAEDRPWRHSSRGDCVAISAPAYGVWRAGWNAQGKDIVLRSKGTSFAVATVAGIAALWLEKHGGRAAVIAKLGSGRQVSEVFSRLLRRTARPFAAGSNADGMGAGIIDAGALLTADLASAQSMDEAIGLDALGAITEPAPGTRAAFEKALAELEG